VDEEAVTPGLNQNHIEAIPIGDGNQRGYASYAAYRVVNCPSLFRFNSSLRTSTLGIRMSVDVTESQSRAAFSTGDDISLR
jgi:hypothetical protein